MARRERMLEGEGARWVIRREGEEEKAVSSVRIRLVGVREEEEGVVRLLVDILGGG